MTNSVMMIKTSLLCITYALILTARFCFAWVSLDSCAGKCGLFKSFPCSCDERCVVYKNCCDDTSEECPGMLAEAMVKFDIFLNSDVICTSDGYFMIESCPKPLLNGPKDETITKTLSKYLNVSDGGNNETVNASNQIYDHLAKNSTDLFSEAGTIRSNTTWDFIMGGAYDETLPDVMFQYFNKLPVTDSNTGLVFVSAEVHRCYVRNETRALWWTLEMELFDTDQPESLTQMSNLMESNRLAFRPPKGLNFNYNLHVCGPGAIGTCETEHIINNTHLSSKCKSFSSIVRSPVTLKVYRNVYCLWCNEGLEVPSTLLNSYLAIKSFKFSGLFSVTSKGVQILAVENGFGKHVAWKLASCNPPAKHGGASQCSIQECKDDAFLIDGTCVFLHEMTYAVQADDCPLDLKEQKRFPLFVKCYMKSKLQVVEKRQEHLNMTVYKDQSSNYTYFMTNVFFYFHLRLRPFQLMSNADQMSKLFHHYCKSRDLIKRKPLEPTSTNITHALIPIFIKTSLVEPSIITCVGSEHYHPQNLYQHDYSLSCWPTSSFSSDDLAQTNASQKACTEILKSSGKEVSQRSLGFILLLFVIASICCYGK